MYYRPTFGMMGPGLKNLLLANIFVFVAQILLPQLVNPYFFGLVPALVIKKLFVWQLVTYMFLHGGFGHIFFQYVRPVDVWHGTGTHLGYQGIC